MSCGGHKSEGQSDLFIAFPKEQKSVGSICRGQAGKKR